jgi:hypothetical protein
VTGLVIGHRFRGPAASGNGGYTCGLVAELVPAEAVEVTLRLPPPLDTPLSVERDGDLVRVLDEGRLVAEARPGELDLDPPAPPSFTDAERLAAAQPPDAAHPFPGCFVCGLARDPGDALCLRPAPAGDGLVVAPWRPTGDPPGARAAWAALDCPGAFAVQPDFSRGICVLGRLTARVLEPPGAGDECVVVGWRLAREGRKLGAGTAVYRGCELLALARAVWIEVDAELRDPQPAVYGSSP